MSIPLSCVLRQSEHSSVNQFDTRLLIGHFSAARIEIDAGIIPIQLLCGGLRRVNCSGSVEFDST
jgi:hypothetical protein